MNTTIAHINRLLAEGGIVAVPGLGVFVPTASGAQYCEATGLVTPPHSRIVYERCDEVDGTTLCASVMRGESIDADSARTIIDADVAAIMGELATTGEAKLGDAGTMVLDGDGAPAFVQSASFVDYSGSAWLSPLRLEALDAVAEVEPSSPAASTLSHRWLRWAGTTAAAMIVFGMVALITVFANRFIGSSGPVEAGMVSAGGSAAVGLVDNSPVGQPGSLVLILNTPADGISPVEPRNVGRPALTPDTYCLIVASLATEAEADAFCRSHSTIDIPLAVLVTDGRYRVYAASAPTMPEVMAIAAERGIQDVFASAWVCRN